MAQIPDPKVTLDVDVDATKLRQGLDDALSALDVEALSSLLVQRDLRLELDAEDVELIAGHLVAHGVRAPGATSNVLGRGQRARAAALHIAKELLDDDGHFPGERGGRLCALAEWIINGGQDDTVLAPSTLRPSMENTTWLETEKA